VVRGLTNGQENRLKKSWIVAIELRRLIADTIMDVRVKKQDTLMEEVMQDDGGWRLMGERKSRKGGREAVFRLTLGRIRRRDVVALDIRVWPYKLKHSPSSLLLLAIN
jgi:hypothetical protein